MSSDTAITYGVLALTSDPGLQASLRLKLEEYKARYFHKAPEASPRGHCKLRLLGDLVEKGTVDFDAVEAEFAERSWYDHRIFREVVEIIRAYNKNDRAGIMGGTGLK